MTRLRPGRVRDRGLIPDRGKTFISSSKCQDCCVGHLASYSMGTGSFLPVSKDSGARIYSPRVPKLRLNAVYLHSHMPSWHTKHTATFVPSQYIIMSGFILNKLFYNSSYTIRFRRYYFIKQKPKTVVNDFISQIMYSSIQIISQSGIVAIVIY